MNQKRPFNVNKNFDKTVQAYLDLLSTTCRPGTVGGYKVALKLFFVFLTSKYPKVTKLSQIRRSPHIESWLTHMANSVSKGTRKHHLMDVRKFFTDIHQWGWEDVPQPGLITHKDFPPSDKFLPRPINPEDDVKLQEFLRSKPDSMAAQALFLLRKTGMRIGEMLSMDANALKKNSDGQYVLHVPIGKLHTERIIPVDDETVEIFNRLKTMRGNFLPLSNQDTGEGTQFLLVKRNQWERYSYSGLRVALIGAARKSGINIPISPHRLRHTYATELLRAGISLPALMKLLGHTDISMTLRYAAVSQSDLITAYHEAIQKTKSLDLLPKHMEKHTENESVFDEINNIIARLNSIRQDSPKGNKKLQRIAERLRRAYQDIEDTLKNK